MEDDHSAYCIVEILRTRRPNRRDHLARGIAKSAEKALKAGTAIAPCELDRLT